MRIKSSLFLLAAAAATGMAQRLRVADKGSIPEEELECHTYKNGAATLQLCEIEIEDYVAEKKRVTKTHLYLTNIGEVGVCHMLMWIEGMGTDDMMEYWPEWIFDEDNESYLDPDEGLDLGANVIMRDDWPKYYLTKSFKECKSPDWVPDDYEPCHTIEGKKDDVVLEWCVDEKLKSWTEGDGTRTIQAQGTLTNRGSAAVCGLVFDLERAEDATRIWPEWFPEMNLDNMDEPMREGDALVVGGAVPAKGGRPKISLTKYMVCPPEYQLQQDDNDDAGAADVGEDEITAAGAVKPKEATAIKAGAGAGAARRV